jgi:hypothetical protein
MLPTEHTEIPTSDYPLCPFSGFLVFFYGA